MLTQMLQMSLYFHKTPMMALSHARRRLHYTVLVIREIFSHLWEPILMFVLVPYTTHLVETNTKSQYNSEKTMCVAFRKMVSHFCLFFTVSNMWFNPDFYYFGNPIISHTITQYQRSFKITLVTNKIYSSKVYLNLKTGEHLFVSFQIKKLKMHVDIRRKIKNICLKNFRNVILPFNMYLWVFFLFFFLAVFTQWNSGNKKFLKDSVRVLLSFPLMNLKKIIYKKYSWPFSGNC